MEKESKNVIMHELVAVSKDDCTKLTAEELERAIYAVQVEVEEEGQLFAECYMFLQSEEKNLEFLCKLLGADEERYGQIVEILDKNLNQQRSEWPEFLKRHRLPWEKSDFSEYYQKELQKVADQSWQEAEVETRFRMLINGRKEGFNGANYKDFIESKGYHFSDFEYLLNGYGDKFMGRLVRKFFEREKEQTAIKEWKDRRKKELRWKLICFLFLAFIIIITQSEVVLLIAIYFAFLVEYSDYISKPIETI